MCGSASDGQRGAELGEALGVYAAAVASYMAAIDKVAMRCNPGLLIGARHV